MGDSSDPAASRQRTGLCDQKCGRPGVILWGRYDEDDSRALHLCIPCHSMLTAALAQQQEQRERMVNAIVGHMDDLGGLGRAPMFPPRTPVVLQGGAVFNNIDIRNSNVGLVNTGTVGQVDVAITAIRNQGHEEVAAALKELTEGLLRTEMAANVREEALELVSLLSIA